MDGNCEELRERALAGRTARHLGQHRQNCLRYSRKQIVESCASDERTGKVFMSGDRESKWGLRGLTVWALMLAAACVAAQGRSSEESSLHIMPLPRSLERGVGELVLNKHFRAVIDGQHDARLDAALD